MLDQQTRSETDAENEEVESLQAESKSLEALIRFSVEDSLAASPSLLPSVPLILPSTSLPDFSYLFQSLNPISLILE